MSAIQTLGAKDFFSDITTGLEIVFPKLEQIITAMSTATGIFGKMSAGATALFGTFTPLVGVIAAVGTAFAVWSGYDNYIQRQVDEANKAGSAWEESKNKISGYADRVEELRSKLASGTLTETEAYNAKAELLSIQQELSSSYGDQIQGIDLVNGSLTKQLEIINELNQAEANKYINENKTGIDKATKEMEKNREWFLGEFYKDDSDKGVSALQSAIDRVNKKYKDVLSTKEGANGETLLYFDGDVSQAKDALNEFMTYVRESSEELGGNNILDGFVNGTEEQLSIANDILEKYQDVYNKAKTAEIIGDTKLYKSSSNESKTAASWLNDYSKAIEKYNNALASGDSSKISEAKTEFESLDNSVKSLLDSDMGKYSSQFAEIKEQLNSAGVAAEKFKNEINGVEKGSGKLKSLASDLKSLGLSDTDFVYAFETDGIQAGESEINNLVKAALKMGVISDTSSDSVAHLASVLVELGIISGKPADELSKTESALKKLQDTISEYTQTQEKIQSALSNSKSATGLTQEDINNVTNAYKNLDSFNAYKLFEETAHGVHLNTEELSRLNEEVSSNKLKAFADTIENLKQKISEMRMKGEDTSGLEAELRSAQLLKSELEGATSAYNKYIQATNASKERDSYEGVGKSYEEMKKTLDQGWYGDESLNAYLDLLLSAQKRTGDARKDFAQLDKTISGTSHSLMDYWKYDKDGNIVTDGLFDFMDDVNKKLGDSFAKKNKDGLYEFDFDGDKLKKVAEEFGTTTEMVELFERALIDAGMAVDLGNIDFTGQIDKAISTLKDLQKSGDFSESINLDFDVNSASLDDTKSYIDQLKNERIKIDAETNPEAAAALDELISKCESDYFVKLNLATGGSLEEASAVVQRLKELTDTPITQEVKASNVGEITALSQKLAELPESVQIAVGVEAKNLNDPNAIINQLKVKPETINVPMGFNPDASKAYQSISSVEQQKVNDKVFDIRANDYASSSVLVLQNRLDSLKGKTINIYENTYRKTIPIPFGMSEGTAHADGTIMSMWNNYRSSIGAYSVGRNWSLPHNEKALVNEVGTESIVRNGRWFPIPGGAHVEQLKKGDIIFSAKQTEELIRTGRVVSGGGHGRVALADGTAYSMINAYDKGSGGSRRPGSGSSSSSSNKYKKPSKKKSTKKKSSSSSKANKDAKEFEETLDLIEIAINRITQAIDRVKIKAESVFNVLSSRNGAVDEEISKITQKINLQSKAYDGYMKKANSIGLSESWAKKIRDGSIEISTIKDEDLAKKIKEYKEFYEKATEAKDAIAGLHEEIAKLYNDKFNNISNDFENKLSLIEHLTTTYDNGLSKLEEQGYFASSKYYTAMQGAENEKIKIQKQELSELIKAMSEGVNSGKIKEGSEAWYKMQQEINSVKESIQESETEVIKLQNAIREIEWERFDFLQDQISSITEESDFVTELLSKSDLHDKESGKFTDAGMATAGIHGQNYNVYMAQADKYAEEIKKINAEIAKDPNNTKLLERREELLEAQRDSILAAEDEKEAIKDLVKDGIDIAIESFGNLIDKYTEALDEAKDLYDYQKMIKDKTSEIAKLQKQIAAYAGDDSEESMALKQELELELSGALEDLEEAQYDRYISEQKKILDELYNEYETILNQRLDNTDALLTEIIGAVNADSSSIGETIISETEKVGYTISENLKSIWASDGGATSIITKYGDMFSSALTTVNSVLNSISANVSKMVGESDKEADKVIGETKPSTPTTPKPAPPKPTPTPPPKPSTPQKVIKVGGKINAGAALIYDYAGDKSGERQYFRKDPIYTVLQEKNGYLKVRHKSQSKGVTGWFKKSDVKAYKTGGLVDYTGLAWVDGKKTKPESFLNSEDTENITKLRNTLRDIQNGELSIDKVFFGNNSNEFANALKSGSIHKVNQNVNNGDISYTINIPIDHVSDYNDFVNKLRKDNKFEKLVQSITIDRINGGSKLSKNQYKW